ncbi:MAG: hypothetical protein JNM94_15935 [Phycisphaerae bacterium]|nr:hypothetical protein [Phycisphaerae bacterium]
MPKTPPISTNRVRRCAECGTTTDFGRSARRRSGLLATVIALAVVTVMSLLIVRVREIPLAVVSGTARHRAVVPGYAPADVAAIAAGTASLEAAEAFRTNVRDAIDPDRSIFRVDGEMVTFAFTAEPCHRSNVRVRGWPAAIWATSTMSTWPSVYDALGNRAAPGAILTRRSTLALNGVVLLASLGIIATVVAASVLHRSTTPRRRRMIVASTIVVLAALGTSALLETERVEVLLGPDVAPTPTYYRAEPVPDLALPIEAFRDDSPTLIGSRELAAAIVRMSGFAEAPNTARLAVRVQPVNVSGAQHFAAWGSLMLGNVTAVVGVPRSIPAASLARAHAPMNAESIAVQWSGDGDQGWRLEITTGAIAASVAALLVVRGVVLVLMHVLSRRRRRIASGKCPRCGYVVIPDLLQAPVDGSR